MVISQDENDKKKQKDDEERAAIKRKEVQNIQKMQIRGVVSPDSRGPLDA
jgi:hypothetical protein